MEELFGEPISVYTNANAVEDGIKGYLFQNRWEQLSGGKPITATASLIEAFSLAAFQEMWNDFVNLRAGRKVPSKSKLDGGPDFMVTEMNGEPIWLVEDGECFTFLRPSEY